MKYPVIERFKSFQHSVDKIFNINLMLRPNIVRIIELGKFFYVQQF